MQEMASAELEKRIEALEKGAAFDATKTAVHQVEAECLMKLREIRTALVAEAANTNGAAGAGGSVVAVAASSKELQQLQTENDALKRKIAKLEYRVEHMVSSMEDLYNKNKAVECRASF